jgi:hypothetical protein
LALTLFVVPSLYALLARNTRSPEYLSRAIDKLRDRSAGEGTPQPGAASVSEKL